MFTHPARCLSPDFPRQPRSSLRHGGKLARDNTQRAGLLLSLAHQSAQQCVTDFANGHEAGVSSLPARGAGAATDRRSPCAESRPFLPFVQINHVAHQHLLSSETTGTAIPRDGQVVRETR